MKLTVITVCLNSADTIERTIKSVIAQADETIEIEYIVIDGGSVDGTLSVLERYRDYVDCMVSEPDKGVFDGMNKGIGLSTGDVIAFLNSDDWYENGILKIVAKAFETENCDCVCCDNYVIERDGHKVYFDTSDKTVDDLFVHMIYYHSAIFCKKEFFSKRDNFDLRYKMAADYDWFLRAIQTGATLYYVHKPAFTFSYGGISSVNAVACAKEARKIALEHLPEEKAGYRERIDRRLYETVLYAVDEDLIVPNLTELLSGNATVLWGAGARGRQWIRWFQRMGICIEGIVDHNHLLWGERIEGVPVSSPKQLGMQKCNLIITPEKYVEEIKTEIDNMRNKNIRIYELDGFCKLLAETVVGELL